MDLSRYFAALETFKAEHYDEVIKSWKTEKVFDSMVKLFKKKEKQITMRFNVANNLSIK